MGKWQQWTNTGIRDNGPFGSTYVVAEGPGGMYLIERFAAADLLAREFERPAIKGEV